MGLDAMIWLGLILKAYVISVEARAAFLGVAGVGVATVAGDVETCQFLLYRDPQDVELVQGVEERAHGCADPAHDRQDLDHLGSK